jgi:hypothetical protein
VPAGTLRSVSDTRPTALPVGTARARPPIFRHPWRVAIVVVGLLAAANLGILVLNKSDTTRITPAGLPTTISSIDPNPGELIRPQDTITVDLRTDLTGALVLDGQEIPESQLARIPGLGEVSFRPGPGKDLGQFAPGTHSVTIEYWSATKPRPIHPATFSWTFRVGA